jgi:nitric oxide reductase NorE protein
MFSAGKASLHPMAGLICTLSLITSSYFVALAVIKLKQGEQRQTFRLLLSYVIAVPALIAAVFEFL